ncbi:radical SAM protein [Candidatus Fermentibacteria bacterium]|nr:radical SAM protein [Candidatus Fermentibacteria bacterium]
MSCLDEKPQTVAEAPTQATIDLPEGVPPLGSIYLYASGGCNLACRHCWITPSFDPEGRDVDHIKLDYVRKAIDEGRSLGLSAFKLTGGEPMLHPQFRELVEIINDAGLSITIETNGTFVDGDMAKFLKSKEKMRFISVSLDGATAEMHEYMRGVEGCFDRAVNGIKNLVEVGYRPQVICTLHKGNIGQVDDLVAFAESIGAGSVKFNHVQLVGRGEGFHRDHGLQISDIIELNGHLNRELRPKAKISIFLDIPFAFRTIRELSRGNLGTCGVLTILGMLADGKLALCGIGVTVPELVYGHIAYDDLRDVWCDSPGLKLLRDLIPLKLEGICGDCLHRDMCRGECVANNFHVAGRLNAPYFFCDIASKAGIFPASRTRSA